MSDIATRKLGLAAYIKIKGQKFLGYIDEKFRFEGDGRSEAEWEAEYMNTECYAHDSTLMSLRRLIQR